MSIQAVAQSKAGGSAGVAQQRSRPNVVVLMTDDETVQDMEVMPRTRALLGGHGVTFARSYVSSGLLPFAGDVLQRPVRPQPRRDGPVPADWRVRSLQPLELAAGL